MTARNLLLGFAIADFRPLDFCFLLSAFFCPKPLSAEEVAASARAFSSLARMDLDFGARAEVVADAKRATADAGRLGEQQGNYSKAFNNRFGCDG